MSFGLSQKPGLAAILQEKAENSHKINDLDGLDFELLDDISEESESYAALEEELLLVEEVKQEVPDRFGNQRLKALSCLTDKTCKQYLAVAHKWNTFCIENKWLVDGLKMWECAQLDPEIPFMIVAFIQRECDYEDMDGRRRAQGDAPSSIGHAGFIRSAIVFVWGFFGKRGKIPWDDNTCTGNPGISYWISSYLRGLQRRKVQIYGEKSVSSRAITGDVLKQLYRHSLDKINNPEGDWATPILRVQQHTIMVLTFQGFLRPDECLSLQAHQVQLYWSDKWQNHYLSVSLYTRKNHQTGGKHLYSATNKILTSRHQIFDRLNSTCSLKAGGTCITTGYLFRSLNKDLQIVLDKPSIHLRAAEFLLYFRNMLVDIGVESPYSYGGQSFRRGGVQFFHEIRGWSIREICCWGGWSSNFTYLTVLKYLISWNDSDWTTENTYFVVDFSGPYCCKHCGRS